MGFDIIALSLFFVGLYIIFSKDNLGTTLYSFLLTLFLFAVLVLSKLYVLALTFLIVDSIVKIKLFLFFTNKKIQKKPPEYLKNKIYRKSFVVIIVTMFVGGIYILRKSVPSVFEVEHKQSLEIMIMSLVITIFVISGYVVKSDKWTR